jgi:hypothetical protein
MYKHNNKRFHRLALAAMLLLSTNLMAEESQDEYGSDIQLQNMANDWQRAVLVSLTSQLQQSSEPLIAVQPVVAPPSRELILDTRAPNSEMPMRLSIEAPADLHFTLDDQQPLPGSSEHLSQVEG